METAVSTAIAALSAVKRSRVNTIRYHVESHVSMTEHLLRSFCARLILISKVLHFDKIMNIRTTIGRRKRVASDGRVGVDVSQS
jgi:hypothetical protein